MSHLRVLGTVLMVGLIAGCCGRGSSSNPNNDLLPTIPVVDPAAVTPPPVGQQPMQPMPPTQPMPPMGQPPMKMPGVPGMGNVVAVNAPASGIFTPGLPTDPSGKPFIDYTLTIATPGNYRIDLMSSNTMSYDPYIILLQNGVEIGRDDDGGDQSLQSRLTRMLQPGTYTVRVTKFGSSQATQAVPFTLMVTQS